MFPPCFLEVPTHFWKYPEKIMYMSQIQVTMFGQKEFESFLPSSVYFLTEKLYNDYAMFHVRIFTLSGNKPGVPPSVVHLCAAKTRETRVFH